MKQIICIFYIIIIFNIDFVYSKENNKTNVKKENKIQNYYNVKYLDNYDGDTIYFEIFSSKNRNEEVSIKKIIRLKAVDTKEIKSKNKTNKNLAIKSKQFVKNELNNAERIDLLNCTIEKFGRMFCAIDIDNKDLGKLLIKNKLAIKYNGEKKNK